MNRLIFTLVIGCVMPFSLQASTTIDEGGNPFRVIVASNVFRLRPIPPDPPPRLPEPPPAAPLAQVMLTGIHTVFGPPQAFFEVTETASGKAVSSKPILREGEQDGPIHVLAIDVERSLVRIRNGTIETNLTFNPLKQPAAPAVAAAVPLPIMNKPLPPALPPAHGG